MKIYLYLKHFPPNGNELNEGTSKAVHGLASGLAACGAEVIILCEGSEKDGLYESQAGYQVASFHSKDTNPSFRISPGLKKYINTVSEQSLFILNGIFHRSVYSLSRLLKKYNLPYIIAPHDPYHPTIFQKNAYLKWPYWLLFEKRMLRQADAVQVLDKRHSEWLHRLNVKIPTIEVPNGFSPGDVHPDSTLNWNFDSIPNFLFLGRLDSYNKGLDVLLDAFAQLTELPNWKLTVQGPDWGDRLALEQQAHQLGISQNVTFLEPDYNSSPSAIIAKYDVFCITSRFEGFSLSALEAMLAGRVLLVSKIAGISPHVEKSGCGVSVHPEPSSIKVGLVKLLEQRLMWQKMGLQGRQYVLKNLHWDSIASNALEQYKQLGKGTL